MNSTVCRVLISICLQFFLQRSGAIREERSPILKGFLAYKTISSFQKYCTCSMTYSCSCCQSVLILYTKSEKNLCVNFIYQGNGIMVDVALNFNSIRTRRVTDYKPLKFCVNVPGCLFSSACINVLELNQFSRSITACLRLDIYSKKQIWQINYDCVSISTQVPTTASNGTTQMMTGTTGGSSGTATTMKTGMTSPMSSSQMTMTTMKMTTTTMMTTTMTTMTVTRTETEETTSDVEFITVPGSQPTTVADID
ncbi:PREDICTED: uncharacterized protein LOC107185735 [Dufourea novaeangliae]|uniref:uncharacterized protein LOC107185735 n=1 Tax=Dufourea novaeangliae TaxID=178035 RepID=UPI0007679869|nr:PREDICTED: uncharacterized protein LOC107185735 [Dufourea novaeangliae]